MLFNEPRGRGWQIMFTFSMPHDFRFHSNGPNSLLSQYYFIVRDGISLLAFYKIFTKPASIPISLSSDEMKADISKRLIMMGDIK